MEINWSQILITAGITTVLTTLFLGLGLYYLIFNVVPSMLEKTLINKAKDTYKNFDIDSFKEMIKNPNSKKMLDDIRKAINV